MAILASIRRLASNLDAKKREYKVARKIEAYKASKSSGKNGKDKAK